ncbi:MAG TPA: TlpA disulfide reductase family protein, partial [Polyangiales bacterium]|nr:TlpA disulfide reductase family protein [Polyangiales bacterium]
MRRTWGWVGALSLVVFSACAGKAPPAQQPAPQGPSIVVTPEMGHPHVGDAAPELEVTTPEGEKLQLSSLRGQVVVLAFVTSWCPFSQAEQPNLAKLAHDYAGSKDLRVVIVDIDQNEEGYRQYLARQDMGAPVYWTASAEAAQAWVPPNA